MKNNKKIKSKILSDEFIASIDNAKKDMLCGKIFSKSLKEMVDDFHNSNVVNIRTSDKNISFEELKKNCK